MRSLEVCIQRIFDNLIKQNHKLSSPVNNSVQCLDSSLQRPETSVQHLRQESGSSGMPGISSALSSDQSSSLHNCNVAIRFV